MIFGCIDIFSQGGHNQQSVFVYQDRRKVHLFQFQNCKDKNILQQI